MKSLAAAIALSILLLQGMAQEEPLPPSISFDAIISSYLEVTKLAAGEIHAIEFFLSFRDEQSAGRARTELNWRGVATHLRKDDGHEKHWSLTATAKIPLTAANLRERSDSMADLALRYEGEYSGFGLARSYFGIGLKQELHQ